MNKAVISGDIIAFTSLSNANKQFVEDHIKKLFEIIKHQYACYCRLIKGDYLECVIEHPEKSLEVALLIKTFIKSLAIPKDTSDKRIKYFKNYGIRLAIGIGKLTRYDKNNGIIDGEAVYLSGRKINDESTHNKKRIVIKNTLYFVSTNPQLNQQFEAFFSLIDFILNKATAKQCEVVFYKLQGFKEKEIAAIMDVSQPVINQHSLSVGWNALETAVNYYQTALKNN